MRALLALGTLAWALACAAAAALDSFEIETEDAIIVEAADLPDTLRAKRQLWATYPDSGLDAPLDLSPGPLSGLADCATADGRSGFCLTRTSCTLTREAEGDDLQKLERSLGNCLVISSSSRRGEPTTRGVCCPTLNAWPTPAPAGGVTQWWQTQRPQMAPTHWWQGTQQRSTTSAPQAVATQWWQSTAQTTTRAPQQPGATQWWQSTARTTTRAPQQPGATQWWQSTARPTTTTTRGTQQPAATQWWQSTAAVTPPRPGTPPPKAEGAETTTPYPFITHAWQATKKTTAKPGGGGGGGDNQWWTTTKTTTKATTARPPVGVTNWWDKTTTAGTTTKATTARPPVGVTNWWDKTTTAKTTAKPPVTQWWATTTPSPAEQPKPQIPVSGGGNYAACGTFSTEGADRIVGGSEAEQGEFPWLVALFDGGRQFCGGSLIDKTHVLTAAHCVAHMSAYNVAQLKVRLGDYDIRSSTEAKHDEFKVARIVRHKEFSQQTLHKDVAIITLSKPATYRTNIRPVCLDSGGSIRAGELATVAGWGSLREPTQQQPPVQPSRVQKVSLKVWENARCKATYGSQAPGGIIDSMLCAGRKGKDSCSGDSGGPLMKLPAPVVQVGIVSWGIGCGKADYPGVYTRVSKVRDWIDRNRSKY